MPVKTKQVPEKYLAMKAEIESRIGAVVSKYVGSDPNVEKQAIMKLGFDDYGRLDSASVSVYAPKYGNDYELRLFAMLDLDTVDVVKEKKGRLNRWAAEDSHKVWLTRPKVEEFNLSIYGYDLKMRVKEDDKGNEDEYRRDIKALRREEKRANKEMLKETEGVFKEVFEKHGLKIVDIIEEKYEA